MSLLPPARGLSHQAHPVVRNEALLVRIFAMVVEWERLSLMPAYVYTAGHVLSFVSRTWRRAALNTPELWRFIRIDCMRLRSSTDLSLCRLSVRNSVERSRGTVHRVSLCHFPGQTPVLSEYLFFWEFILTIVLDVCERLHLSISALDDSKGGYPYHNDIEAVLSIVADCVAPKMTHLEIVSGTFHSHPRIRYDLRTPFFNPGKALSLQSFITNCIDMRDYSILPHRPIDAFSLSGGYHCEAAHFIRVHYMTLRNILLYQTSLVLRDINVDLVALSTLSLTGSSVDLLSCLRLANLPQLTYLILAFDSEHDAAVQLAAFVRQHPETYLRSLMLRSLAKTPAFADFVPALLSMRHLSCLRLGGPIESAFFISLAEGMPRSVLRPLDQLVFEYDGRLDSLVPGLLRFLGARVPGTGSHMVHDLMLFRTRCIPMPTPFDYSTAKELTAAAPSADFRIDGRLVSKLLDDMDYWLPVHPVKVIASILAYFLAGIFQIYGPYRTWCGGYVLTALFAFVQLREILKNGRKALVAPTVGYLGDSLRIALQLATQGKLRALTKHALRTLHRHLLLSLSFGLVYFFIARFLM